MNSNTYPLRSLGLAPGITSAPSSVAEEPRLSRCPPLLPTASRARRLGPAASGTTTSTQDPGPEEGRYFFSYELRNVSQKALSKLPLLPYCPGGKRGSHPNETMGRSMELPRSTQQIQSHRPGLGKSHPYVTRNFLWKHMDSWAKLGQLTRKGGWLSFRENSPRVSPLSACFLNKTRR